MHSILLRALYHFVDLIGKLINCGITYKIVPERIESKQDSFNLCFDNKLPINNFTNIRLFICISWCSIWDFTNIISINFEIYIPT